MAFLDLLTQTCNITRISEVSTDSFGDANSAFVAVNAGTGLRCRYQQLINKWAASPSGVSQMMQYVKPYAKLYVEAVSGLVIKETDRIYVVELERDLNVKKAQMDSSTHHWELEVEDFEALN